jgi:sterol desaturase/sphingolipid hydroxylase (fatty acid hydroxylase superfamily)
MLWSNGSLSWDIWYPVNNFVAPILAIAFIVSVVGLILGNRSAAKESQQKNLQVVYKWTLISVITALISAAVGFIVLITIMSQCLLGGCSTGIVFSGFVSVIAFSLSILLLLAMSIATIYLHRKQIAKKSIN